MDYESLVEKNVNHMMEKMFGDKDPALKTVTKMNLMFDGEDESLYQMENYLTKMKKMNYFEAKCINEELQLTYNTEGNIVSINNIKDETENDFCEESKDEHDTEFRPSNR